MALEIVGYENCHRHSDRGSLQDGYATVEEYAKYSKQANQQYLCITDHGMMSAVPQQIKYAEKHKLNPIFGCELYVNPMQIACDTDEDRQKYIKRLDPDSLSIMKMRGAHLLAIATSIQGYSNLVKLCSWGHIKGFYYKPRVNHEQLMKYKEGIVFTSCCYASEVGKAFDKGGEDAGNAMIEKYIAMFGKENYYLEIMLLDFAKQRPYNKFIIKAADKYGLKCILSNDVHYCNKNDSQYQRYMIMMQTKKTVQDIQKKLEDDDLQDMFELQDTNLWMKTEEELNEKWEKDYKDDIDYDFFKAAKINTVELCRRAKGVQLDRTIKLPQIESANDKLYEFMIQGFKARNLPKTRVYLDRLKEEYSLITRKEFSSYFLIQKQMCDEARRVCKIILGWGDGWEAYGPGRGSDAASLILYCLGITDVDPVEHDLFFGRFISEVRGGKSISLRFKNVLPLEKIISSCSGEQEDMD